MMDNQHIFDSHAHYDDERFSADAGELLSSFPDNGVSGVMTCGVNLPTSRAAVALATKFPFVWAAVGFHGLNTEDLTPDFIGDIEKLAAHPRVKAIGEIGLDYHYEKESRDLQLTVFEQQLILANKLQLPVIVHDREAHADVLELLQRHKPRGVVHCFSGSVEMAREVLKLGLYIGIGGAVTFKNAVKPAQVAAAVPSTRLLIETDAPYMAPVPFRGERCTSLHIPYTAQRLAQIRGTDAQEILDLTDRNARELFGI